MYQFEPAAVPVGVDVGGVGTIVISPGSTGLGVAGVVDGGGVGLGSGGAVVAGGVVGVGVGDTSGDRSITTKVVK